MIKKFNSLNISEKIIILLLTTTYTFIIIRLFLNTETITFALENLISFLILYLWLFLINNFKCIEKWFDKNELRISLTVFCAIIFLYLNNEMLISKSFTSQIINLMQVFLISSILIKIRSKDLINNNDALICIITLYFTPILIEFNVFPFIIFLLIILSTYILTGAIIKGIKNAKLKKDFVVDIIGLILSIVSIIISIIERTIKL